MPTTMSDIIRRGNIRRTDWEAASQPDAALYLGSGRCGGRFDAFGLMNDRLYLMHADHWHRGPYGQDFWLPLASIGWLEPETMGTPVRYSQELHVYDGRLVTTLGWPGMTARITVLFSPRQRDLLAIRYEYETDGDKTPPPLRLTPCMEKNIAAGSIDERVMGTLDTWPWGESDERWAARLRIGTADTLLALRLISKEGLARLEKMDDGTAVQFEGPSGSHLLLLGMCGTSRAASLITEMDAVEDGEAYPEKAVEAWHERWGDSYVELPSDDYQALWVRSLYYLLSSYGPDVRCPAPPMGWSGQGWAYAFPQDLSYIHPALLRLGHSDIVKSWVEFFRGYVSSMEAFTRDVFGAEGTMWAWEFPIGPDSRMIRDGSPHPFHYQIHNAAYPARMARDTAVQLGDTGWSMSVAWPIVQGSARFFASILRREADGKWGIELTPSMGQDELGGQNAKNYLCSLFAASYCLHTAIEMAAELGIVDKETAWWAGILQDGMAFGRLEDKEQGILTTYEGQLDEEEPGRQKHPVQLHPYVFLPQGEPDGYARRAYDMRYQLCEGAENGHFYGWTLPAYWVASVHAGDAEGLLRGLEELESSRLTDREWSRIFESSDFPSVFVTSHGLCLQALNDMFVHDFFGEVRIGGACPSEWGEAAFVRLHVGAGRIISGRRTTQGDWLIDGEKRHAAI